MSQPYVDGFLDRFADYAVKRSAVSQSKRPKADRSGGSPVAVVNKQIGGTAPAGETVSQPPLPKSNLLNAVSQAANSGSKTSKLQTQPQPK